MTAAIEAKLRRPLDEPAMGELRLKPGQIQFSSNKISYKFDLSNISYLQIERKTRWQWTAAIIMIIGILLVVVDTFADVEILPFAILTVCLGVIILAIGYQLRRFHLIVATNGEELEFLIGSEEGIAEVRTYYDEYLNDYRAPQQTHG